ncbi:hypothetical protein MLGJGCBP_03263 [Rhodococcus sp. T7]|nr:hypothetical protein MLGJGCBP_03263 [Rhodococcus sp. T7]
MNLRDLQSGLGPVTGPFLLLGQCPLRLRQPRTIRALVAGVGDLLPRRERVQARDPGVEPDHPIDRLEFGDRVLDEDRNVVLTASIARHRHLRRHGPLRKRPRPPNLQGFGLLGQPELPAPVGEAVRIVRRRILRPALPLELRVAGLRAPEPLERTLQLPQRLLQRPLRRLRQPLRLGIALPSGEHRRGVRVGDSPLFLRPGPRPLGQRPVVDIPGAPERPSELFRLHRSRIEAVFERPLHHPPHHDPDTSHTVRHLALAARP